MEIVVDAYGPEERAMSWYYYLADRLQFPFSASCVATRAASPLQVGDEVDVIGMPGEDECASEMFVMIRWDSHRHRGRRGLAVPLSQLEPQDDAGEETCQAVEDWQYWVEMGYEF